MSGLQWGPFLDPDSERLGGALRPTGGAGRLLLATHNKRPMREPAWRTPHEGGSICGSL
jgi:hypothetical protein